MIVSDATGTFSAETDLMDMVTGGKKWNATDIVLDVAGLEIPGAAAIKNLPEYLQPGAKAFKALGNGAADIYTYFTQQDH
ncbi:MAG: hypothetical protein JWR52_2884 [Marmoricola sp.]|nr:hypothetical protein [Marmoricola sp.]